MKRFGDVADGLDEGNWQILCDAVDAAYRGDVTAAGRATRRFDTDVAVDAQAGLYLRYLIRYRLADLLGRTPAGGDLNELAERVYPRFAAVIRGDISLLENTWRTACRLATDDQKVTGGKFLALGVAALGVLLDDPDTDLRQMRPHLADWWRTNLEKFRALGALEDRSGDGRILSM